MESTLGDPPPGTAVVATTTARIWLGEDGILRVCCLPGSVHTLKEAHENKAAFQGRLHGKVPILIDLREIGSISREAREFWRSPANDNICAAALLVDSPLSTAIGNFFAGLSKMTVEHRLFICEADALDWLRSFLR